MFLKGLVYVPKLISFDDEKRELLMEDAGPSFHGIQGYRKVLEVFAGQLKKDTGLVWDAQPKNLCFKEGVFKIIDFADEGEQRESKRELKKIQNQIECKTVVGPV